MSTKGERYAGIRQDNQDIPEVMQIRGVVAAVIDNLDALATSNPHALRLVAMAQTKFEEACMLAVKAVYTAAQSEDPAEPQ